MTKEPPIHVKWWNDQPHELKTRYFVRYGLTIEPINEMDTGAMKKLYDHFNINEGKTI